MRFYLLNETPVLAFRKNVLESAEKSIIVFGNDDVPCNLTTFDGATPLEHEHCSRLAQSIKNNEISKNGIELERDAKLWTWRLGINFKVDEQPGNNTIRALKIFGGPLCKIIDRCREQNRLLQFEMCLEIYGLNGAHFTKWSTNRITPEFWKYKAVHEVSATKLPTDIMRLRYIPVDVVGQKTVEAFVTFCLILDEPEKSLNRDLMENSLNKQILEGGMFCDATIVAEDGTEIKCHKTFLCAQSPVLSTMLHSTFVEGQTSRIKMVDMSEKAVRAFLRYIYYLDTQMPEAECQIALDLMKAGDKYDIGSLTESMKNIFLSKQAAWFTVDVALESYVLARNVESLGDELKRKCVQALKKNPVKLQKLDGFHRLFSEDSDAAKELCLLAMDANHKYSKHQASKRSSSQQGYRIAKKNKVMWKPIGAKGQK